MKANSSNSQLRASKERRPFSEQIILTQKYEK